VNTPPVIALLCSTGGLDAVTRVLVPLPADVPAAVLVLQHLERGGTAGFWVVHWRPSRSPAGVLGRRAPDGAVVGAPARPVDLDDVAGGGVGDARVAEQSRRGQGYAVDPVGGGAEVAVAAAGHGRAVVVGARGSASTPTN
jgi:two-component system chemotaxis response regulator CheB